MKFFGWLVVIGVVLYLWSKGKFSALTSAGNPNIPPGQIMMPIGPQGPNDGSNSYVGSGHTLWPGDANPTLPDQDAISRSFRYTGNTQQYSGAVRVQPVY